MAKNPKRRGNAASTSFRKDEVEAGIKIFMIILRGGDASIVLRTEAGRRMHRKFVRMAASIREGKSGV